MNQKAILLSTSLVLFAAPAFAKITEMTCTNPRQGYSVTFDETAEIFLIGAPGDDTSYSVESIEHGKHGLIVRGKTVKDGPGFIAHLGGEKRIEFVDGGEVFQTDPCE